MNNKMVISYEIVECPHWPDEPIFRRSPDGGWDAERWSDDYWHDIWVPLENTKLIKTLEAEYQELLEQRKLA